MNTRAAAIYALVITAALCLLDCAFGGSEWRPGQVTDKSFTPSYLHTVEHTDGKGKTWTTTEYEPAKYRIYVRTTKGFWGVGQMHVNPGTYYQWNTGDRCEVLFRHGHLTTYGYLGIRRPEGSW